MNVDMPAMHISAQKKAGQPCPNDVGGMKAKSTRQKKVIMCQSNCVNGGTISFPFSSRKTFTCKGKEHPVKPGAQASDRDKLERTLKTCDAMVVRTIHDWHHNDILFRAIE